MKKRAEKFVDPLEARPFGDIHWMVEETGWSRDKVSRLARLGLIPGAFQSQPETQGSAWNFKKAKTIPWIRSLEK